MLIEIKRGNKINKKEVIKNYILKQLKLYSKISIRDIEIWSAEIILEDGKKINPSSASRYARMFENEGMIIHPQKNDKIDDHNYILRNNELF